MRQRPDRWTAPPSPPAGAGGGQPLVSVVTPVYNGARYLDQCIESVCSQTYDNWEYVIVNNRSTDDTLAIAESYARRDPRIRVHTNETFLPLVENWNHAVRQISSRSKYCKVLHADDLLLPDCLSAMVALAEQRPEIGLVGSLRLMVGGTVKDVRPMHLPSTANVVSGDDACRFYFHTWHNYFGTPSNVMIRSSLIREVAELHNPANAYASDLEAWFTLLSRSSFGIVHSVLTASRRHPESQTSSLFARAAAGNLNRLYLLLAYGERYFGADEFQSMRARRMLSYHRFLFLLLATGHVSALRYHLEHSRRLGVPLGLRATLRAAVTLTRGVVRRGMRRQPDESASPATLGSRG
jgi:glycosyltransferase involved in cell wall biosynthesis